MSSSRKQNKSPTTSVNVYNKRKKSPITSTKNHQNSVRPPSQTQIPFIRSTFSAGISQNALFNEISRGGQPRQQSNATPSSVNNQAENQFDNESETESEPESEHEEGHEDDDDSDHEEDRESDPEADHESDDQSQHQPNNPSDNGSRIEETVPPPIDWITPGKKNWVPNLAGFKPLSSVIKARYTGFWVTFRSIPLSTRRMMFNQWKKCVSYAPEYEYKIWYIWNSRGSKRLSELFGATRKKGKRPHWIGKHIWKQLLVYRKSDDYKKKCTINKNNRNVPNSGCLHTGGPVSMETYAVIMAKELGRKPENAEIFMRNHQKKDKTWVDKKSKTVFTNYTIGIQEKEAASQAAAQEEGGDPQPIDKDEVWVEKAGGRNKKNRVYGDAIIDGESSFAASSQSTSEVSYMKKLEENWDKKFDALSGEVGKLSGDVGQILSLLLARNREEGGHSRQE